MHRLPKFSRLGTLCPTLLLFVHLDGGFLGFFLLLSFYLLATCSVLYTDMYMYISMYTCSCVMYNVHCGAVGVTVVCTCMYMYQM